MASRLALQTKLEELLGSKNVYYQPPESVKMGYPAIVYSINDIESTYANNTKYSNHKKYDVIVISREPDNPVIEKLLALPYCSFNRHYNKDNLSHDALTLYY